MSRIKELQEKRAVAHAAAVEFLKATQTAETRASYEKAMAEVDSLGLDIKNIERADAAEAELRASGAIKTAPVAGAPAGTVDPEKLAKEYRRAFIASLRTMAPGLGFGPEASNHAERANLRSNIADVLDRGVAYEKELRANGDGILEGNPITGHIGSYSGLGFFVPTGFVNDIEQATKYFAPLLDGSVINVIETASGQPLPFPTSNDTTQIAQPVAEAYAINEQDVTASQIVFGAIKFTSGLVKTSIELMQDSAFDLDAWLVQRFAERWGRGLEQYLTVGTGAGVQPIGLLTAVGTGNAVTASGSSESTGGSQTGANSIGYSDLVNLEHSVDPSYRRGAKYMFHDTTLASLKKILDKFGRPLWTPGIGIGAPDTLNSYSYVINQSMPQIAASATTVAFGAMKKFTARKVKDLSVMKLVERYAEQGQIGFVSFARLDSNLLDAGTHPINVLVQHS